MGTLKAFINSKYFWYAVIALTIFFVLYFTLRKKKVEQTFTKNDIPADGSPKEGGPEQIENKAKSLADALERDMTGLGGNDVDLWREYATSSDTFFVSVYNAFGLRQGETLRGWLMAEFAYITPGF